jgi:acyl carrier protein
MDALAHYRRQLGLPGLSINWGPWAEAGMAASSGQAASGRWATHGVGQIEPAAGLAVLGRLMSVDGPAQVAVFPVEWAQLFGQLPGGDAPPFLDELRREAQLRSGRPGAAQGADAAHGAGAAQAQLLDELAAVLPGEREALIRRHVREQAARILGYASAQALDTGQALSDLGLDSIMAVNLTELLEGMIGRRLPATLLFNYPSVDALAGYLAAELAAQTAAEGELADTADDQADDESEQIDLEALGDILAEIEGLSEDEIDALLAGATGDFSGNDDA